eukprot:gene15537-biopygen23198
MPHVLHACASCHRSPLPCSEASDAARPVAPAGSRGREQKSSCRSNVCSTSSSPSSGIPGRHVRGSRPVPVFELILMVLLLFSSSRRFHGSDVKRRLSWEAKYVRSCAGGCVDRG